MPMPSRYWTPRYPPTPRTRTVRTGFCMSWWAERSDCWSGVSGDLPGGVDPAARVRTGCGRASTRLRTRALPPRRRTVHLATRTGSSAADAADAAFLLCALRRRRHHLFPRRRSSTGCSVRGHCLFHHHVDWDHSGHRAVEGELSHSIVQGPVGGAHVEDHGIARPRTNGSVAGYGRRADGDIHSRSILRLWETRADSHLAVHR